MHLALSPLALSTSRLDLGSRDDVLRAERLVLRARC